MFPLTKVCFIGQKKIGTNSRAGLGGCWLAAMTRTPAGITNDPTSPAEEVVLGVGPLTLGPQAEQVVLVDQPPPSSRVGGLDRWGVPIEFDRVICGECL